MQTSQEAIVVGGGLSGLFAAYRLLKHGFSVKLIEKKQACGGLMGTFPVGETDLEFFYHHLFMDDVFLLDACRTLGVDIEWASTRTGFIAPGSPEIHELSAPHHLATFGLLPIPQRLSLLPLLARVRWELLRHGGDVSQFDHVPVEAWFGGRGNRRLFRRFFHPMIMKKWGCRSPEISAAWMMGRLGMRSGRTRKGELLGYPKGGFRQLTVRLEEEIRRLGGDVQTGSFVDRLLTDGGKIRGAWVSGREVHAQSAILTLAPTAAAALLSQSGLNEDAAGMERITYQGALTVVLGLTRPLTDFYWVNVLDPEAPFGAVIEHTNFRPAADYHGPLIYVAAYPDPDSELWTAKDEDVVLQFRRHLERLFPQIRDNPVRWSRVAISHEASPVYACGYYELIPPIRGEVQGLYSTGMFRCYPKRPVDLVGATACNCADLAALDAGLLHGKRLPPGPLPRTLNP